MVKTLSLKLSESLNRKLDIAVSRRKTTKSLIIREALEAHLSTDNRPQKGSVKEAIHDLIGVHEGPGDLSTNSTYLSDFGK